MCYEIPRDIARPDHVRVITRHHAMPWCPRNHVMLSLVQHLNLREVTSCPISCDGATTMADVVYRTDATVLIDTKLPQHSIWVMPFDHFRVDQRDHDTPQVALLTQYWVVT